MHSEHSQAYIISLNCRPYTQGSLNPDWLWGSGTKLVIRYFRTCNGLQFGICATRCPHVHLTGPLPTLPWNTFVGKKKNIKNLPCILLFWIHQANGCQSKLGQMRWYIPEIKYIQYNIVSLLCMCFCFLLLNVCFLYWCARDVVKAAVFGQTEWTPANNSTRETVSLNVCFIHTCAPSAEQGLLHKIRWCSTFSWG